MLKRLVVGLALLLAVAATPAYADTILFSDNFNTEHGGVGILNYSGFTNFGVSDGTVDLIGVGTAWNFFPANGLFVDLDGSTGNAGLMLAHGIALGPGTYTVSFDLAGSQRPEYGAYDTVGVQLFLDSAAFGGVTSYTLNARDPFATRSLSFTLQNAASLTFSFQNSGPTSAAGDNVGALLDNVQVSAVPEPASLLLLGTGLVGLVRLRRRRG